MSELKRVFVAVDISEDARGLVTAYIDNVRRLSPDAPCRWVRPENLHITCWFIGNVDAKGLDGWKESVSLAADALSPFKVELGRTGKFSQHRHHSDVLWIAAKSDPPHRFVEIAQYIHEDKRVKPHLTIGRLKSLPGGADLVNRHLSTEFGPVSFAVNELVIYESLLTPAGSEYTPIYRAQLQG